MTGRGGGWFGGASQAHGMAQNCEAGSAVEKGLRNRVTPWPDCESGESRKGRSTKYLAKDSTIRS